MTSTSPFAAGAREPLLSRRFVLLGLASLAYFTADGIAIYALPLYVTGPVGAGPAGAGLAFGMFAVSALVLRPFAGRLADTLGRRPLLAAGAALCAVSMIATAHVDDLAAILALRLILGVAEAAFFVAAVAALADIAPPDRLGEAISISSLGLYLGLAIGPPVGETVVSVAGFGTAWYVAGALGLVSAGLVLVIGETRPSTAGTGGRAPLIHRPSIPLALGFLASVAAMGGFLAYAALRSQAVGLSTASVPLIVYGAVVVVCRVVFAKVPDRVSAPLLGTGALVTIAAGMSLVAASATPTGLVLGTALLAVGVAFSTPAFFSAILGAAGPAERGAASGTASAAIDLGIGGGPILLGLVAQSAGISWAFAAAAAVAAAGAIWTWTLIGTGPRAISRRPGQPAEVPIVDN